MSPAEFVSILRELRSPDTFNPYRDRCPVFDKPGAPELRVGVLHRILCAASEVELDSIWIGRDLGHRGGRRTGLAFTDDVHYTHHLGRWGITGTLPTIGEPVRERTAGVAWEMLEQIPAPVFLWNVFPLHPFPAGLPFANRAHNAQERKAGLELLSMLFKLLKPERIVAVGKDAANAAKTVANEVEPLEVRHPSYGGENTFRAQISITYGLANDLQYTEEEL